VTKVMVPFWVRGPRFVTLSQYSRQSAPDDGANTDRREKSVFLPKPKGTAVHVRSAKTRRPAVGDTAVSGES